MGASVLQMFLCGKGDPAPSRQKSVTVHAGDTGNLPGNPMMRSLLVLLIGLLAASGAAARELDRAAAEAALNEARARCELDAGALWGVSLCGPMLVVDPQTRALVANQAGPGLTADGEVFTGVLPQDINIANTAFEWNGTRWVMIAAPLPEEAEVRGALLMHESWHGAQPRLGLPAANAAPAHLGTPEGRIMMRLEWRALAAALNLAAPADRRQAAADALTFRAARRGQAGADGAEQERALELSEGLAEYTGVKLAMAEPGEAAAATLRAAERAPAYARAFVYASGPAYGLLLDDMAPGWREGLDAEADLGDLLGSAIGFAPEADVAAAVQAAAIRYDGQAVAEEEIALEAERMRQRAAWVARLVDGPVLRLPFRQMRIGFNPSNLVPMPPHGTVYPTLRITDVWGVLEVEDGALLDEGWSAVAVAAPADAAALSGPGWTLQLNDGWRLVPGERAGDYTLAEAD